MARHFFAVTLALTVLLGAWPTLASAQLTRVVDDVIIITKGQSAKEQAKTHQHLPGAGETALPASPGADRPRLGEPAATAPPPGVLTSASSPPGRRYAAADAPRILPPAAAAVERGRPPLYGALDLLADEDEGPAEGLTLDAAIDRLVQTNYDLLTKFQEIPKAQADILSAGLRLNPLVFLSADNVPYGRYSEQRPGATAYEATVAQPLDVNQKRKARVRVAQQAKRVLEAQYQDAVRLQIDNLYTAFVDVLEARQAVRAMRAGLAGLAEVVKTTRGVVEKGLQPRTDLDRALIQQYQAEVALQSAELRLAQARRNLATLLAVPPQQADCLEVRGTLRDRSPPLACTDDLIHIALEARPDLAAFRLGVQRADAAVRLSRAERFEDLFLFYTPYNYTNNAPTGRQDATSWGLGVLVPLPVFNRNQGNIARAQANAAQTQIEVAGAERLVANDVQRAAAEYAASRAVVERFERDLLPAARRLRDEKYRLFLQGQEGLVAYLEAQREHNDVLRQYLDTLVGHRRNMLRVNTAVGERVAP